MIDKWLVEEIVTFIFHGPIIVQIEIAMPKLFKFGGWWITDCFMLCLYGSWKWYENKNTYKYVNKWYCIFISCIYSIYIHSQLFNEKKRKKDTLWNTSGTLNTRSVIQWKMEKPWKMMKIEREEKHVRQLLTIAFIYNNFSKSYFIL